MIAVVSSLVLNITEHVFAVQYPQWLDGPHRFIKDFVPPISILIMLYVSIKQKNQSNSNRSNSNEPN